MRMTRVLLWAIMIATACAGWSSETIAQSTFPGATWDTVSSDSRWSRDSLRRIGALVDSLGSGAVVVVDDGRVVGAWGAPARKFPIASVRKSLLHALIGIEIGRGTLSVDATLEQLGIDDDPPLTAVERTARVADLLASRSGIFHESAYEPQSMTANRPARGSARPGERWFYNNWDFNALGTIYERASGRRIFEAFDSLIARPLALEDYRPTDGEYVKSSGSKHTAYTFRMSARDLARFGYLYLQRGLWQGRQLVPASWIDESVRPRSEAGPGGSYGMLWWVARDGLLVPGVSLEAGTFAARGAGPHYVIVIPSRRLVIVHLTDTETPSPDKWVERDAIGRLVARILAARQP